MEHHNEQAEPTASSAMKSQHQPPATTASEPATTPTGTTTAMTAETTTTKDSTAPAKKKPSSIHSPLTAIPIPPTFTRRKATILSHLALPDEEYTDLSPKGTVDAGIRELIDVINEVEGLVTTSSCAGRVSVFLEGSRKLAGGAGVGVPMAGSGVLGSGSGRDYGSGGVAGNDGGGQLPSHQVVDPGHEVEDGMGGVAGGDDGMVVTAPAGNGERSAATATVAGVGGKGGGGRWLFVSHEPVELQGKLDSEPNIVGALLGMEEPIFDGREGTPAVEMSGGESRLIHFKFEPMILHVLTASLHHAQLVLSCGLQAGFRESGAINLLPPSSSSSAATPIVAIRSMGLALESLIGRETNGIKHCTVSGDYLKALIKIANERFGENARRIERFRRLLVDAFGMEGPDGEGGLQGTLAGGRKGGAARRIGEGGGAWEDAEVRRERKRLEGLARADEVRRAKIARKKEEEARVVDRGSHDDI